MAANTNKKSSADSKKQSASASAKKGSSGNRKTKTAASKKSSTKSTSGSKRTVSAGRSGAAFVPEKDPTSSLIAREALLWLLLAVCILMFISFFDICGYVGSIVSDFCFGVFGILAYALPFLIFISTMFLISNRGHSTAVAKFLSATGLYLTACSFAALFSGVQITDSVSELYESCAAHKSGGGVIGGKICAVILPALGSIGTGVLLFILCIVFLVVITQKSLMKGMKRQSEKVYHSAKESSARRRELLRQERREREEWRIENTLGYSGDLTEDSMTDSISRGQTTLQGDPADIKDMPRVHSGEMQPQYTAVSRKSKKDTGTRQPRTEIEVPVLFPSGTRSGRSRSKVSGVTRDTKIRGDQRQTSAEIHQIMPSGYIELDDMPEPAREMMPEASGPEVFHDDLSFHIEGIQSEASDAAVSSVEKEVSSESSVPKPGPEKVKRAAMKETSDSLAAVETDTEEIAPAAEQAPPSAKRNPRSSQKEIEEGIASVEAEAAKTAEAVKAEYVYPPLSLLKKGKGGSKSSQEQEIRKTAVKLQQTLESFGVHVTITNVSCGPSVTRYELQPEQGVKVSRIVSLSDDIKLNLAAADIRIEAPIPGKAAVGIEVPNAENSMVALRDLLESDEFLKHPSLLAFATGKDIAGRVVVSDIAKMPHLLIAGATGSGKSVCINTLIMSILYKADPEEVKLIMIDPKVVELSVYNGIPHLFIPVVTDPKKAAGALNWGVAEMTDRYNKFAEFGVRDLKGYNKKIEALPEVEGEEKPKKMPQIVIIVDELADLMMVAPGEVEDSICRLAQLARAAGIHLVIATQRPSVNVITGLIKANMPSRIAFSVTSSVDSRTILDMGGAEKLLGKGDMLFYPQGYQKPARVQGAFVSDEEVSDVVDFLKNQNTNAAYSAEIQEQIAKVQSVGSAARGETDTDALFADAGKFIIEKDKASIGMLQRVFKIGFNRAARIMDQLSDAGVVGPEEGTKPRRILMSEEEFENYLEQN